MAEPFGIAAGAVGIAAAFTACVDCFGYVQLGRHFGRDFQTDVLALNCTRLRLTRWGQAVNIYDDPKLGRPDANPAEIQAAKDTLHHILQLFADTEKISKKYKLSAKPGDDLSTLSTDDMDPAAMALSNKMKKLAIRRQKGSSVLKTASWALYHRSEFKELIQNITSLIDNIEDLFPCTSIATRTRQARDSRNPGQTSSWVGRKCCSGCRQPVAGRCKRSPHWSSVLERCDQREGSDWGRI